MKVTATELPGVLVIEPAVFADERGFFKETYSGIRYPESGVSGTFVQDNVSRSARGVLRGLHFQHPHGQGKLVTVLEGEVFDVAVDVREGSPTFGRWVGERLSAENHRQLWIPPGFAHGFLTLSESALFAYKCTDYYHPETERTIRWDDPDVAVAWPDVDVVQSPRDASAPFLRDMPPERLPKLDR
jgi:dTDP-4-dehydrorhamnose 3,5-epimerase